MIENSKSNHLGAQGTFNLTLTIQQACARHFLAPTKEQNTQEDHLTGVCPTSVCSCKRTEHTRRPFNRRVPASCLLLQDIRTHKKTIRQALDRHLFAPAKEQNTQGYKITNKQGRTHTHTHTNSERATAQQQLKSRRRHPWRGEVCMGPPVNRKGVNGPKREYRTSATCEEGGGNRSTCEQVRWVNPLVNPDHKS